MKEDVEEDTRDSKLQTMKELFPQRSDQELLKVIMLSSLIYLDDYFIGFYRQCFWASGFITGCSLMVG